MDYFSKEDHFMYDYLIVGSGLYGAVVARELVNKGKSALILEKRKHIAGNIYTERKDNVNVHMYGAHIFHTSNEKVWDYVNKFAKFNDFVNCPLAYYKGEWYHMPFNMNTFHEIWGVNTPEEAKEKIESEKRKENIKEITNLEEQAISLVGRTIYEKLVKGYTEKQWGRDCKMLPSFIIKRLPLRFEYNNNYFNDKYQGIPIGGYTNLITNIIGDIEVRLNTDFLENRDYWKKQARFIIYTGAIDEYFDYCFGELEYRSLRFNLERVNKEFYQKNCVINYTEREVPYTRIIEHKYFENDKSDVTWITKEYPCDYKKGMEKYYPVNDEKNTNLYEKYAELAKKEKNIFFGGRLGKYKYYDMDDVIEDALNDIHRINSI